MDPKVYFDPEVIPPERVAAIKDFRKAATMFARTIRDLVPPSEDQRHIMRKLRELTYFANSTISLGGDP